MEQTKVLFLCIHNSARSQMAQAYLESLGGERFHVESAGLEAGTLNPLAVEVMREDGIDISGNPTTDVFDLYKLGKQFDYVVTVCDEASAARCPVFPGVHKTMNWSFPDPSALTGTYEENLATTRIVRNMIKEAVLGMITELTTDRA